MRTIIGLLSFAFLITLSGMATAQPPTVLVGSWNCDEGEATASLVSFNQGGTLTATVADTAELRWWLLGFGDGVEVLGPKALRREIGETASNVARMYQ